MKLTPPKYRTVPLGCIRPEGWLKEQVRLQIDGFFGHMTDISPYLTPRNGWLRYDKTLEEQRKSYQNETLPYSYFAWEEQAYWLRGAYKLALVSRDEKMLRLSMQYIRAVLDSAAPDGWFGPVTLRDVEPLSEIPMPDIWPHMVMMEVLRDYYLESGDEKALEVLRGFVSYCMTIPDAVFMPTMDRLTPGWWFAFIQTLRVCEPVSVLTWLAERTGDEAPLRLSARLFEVFERLPKDGDNHVVNFSQRIKYHATNYAVTGDPGELVRAERHYLNHMAKWGQMPAGLYAADENVREGKHDPRQATETCAMSEITNSFLRMAQYSGDTVYADRTEDIMFNSYPASHTPDYSGLHYLTADNQVMLDDKTHDYNNKGCMTRYDGSNYRCCQHNTGQAWPNFISSMFLTAENRLVVWAYGPASAEINLDGSRVQLHEITAYPFKTDIRFELNAEKAFTLCLRVPAWAKGVCVNGADVLPQVHNGMFELPVPAGESAVTVRFDREVTTRFFAMNHHCVCVDYGPLTFSLKLKEEWTDAGTFTDRAGRVWHRWDVKAASPFNYALDLAQPITVAKEAEEIPAQPFTPESAPVVLSAKAHRVPGWGVDEWNTVQPVPESRMSYDTPEETVELVPLGAMRVRMSCLPHCNMAHSDGKVDYTELEV